MSTSATSSQSAEGTPAFADPADKPDLERMQSFFSERLTNLMPIPCSPLRIGILAFLGLFLLATVIGVSVALTTPRRRRGRMLGNAPAPHAPLTSRSEYAFNVDDNNHFCKLRTTRVPLERGVKDYSRTLNATAKALSAAGGGTMLLSRGTYVLSRQLWVPSNVCVRGAGMDRTTLKMADLSPAWARAGMVRIYNASRVSLLDFTADGNVENQLCCAKEQTYGRYGLYAENFKYLWVRGVRMVNHREYGFDPHGVLEGKRRVWSHYLVIERCEANRNGLDGFTLDQTRHISLLDSSAEGNKRHGVNVVTGSKDVVVRRVTARDNGLDRKLAGCGIMVQNNNKKVQTRDCILDRNVVVDAFRGGVCVDDSINVTISNTKTTIRKYPKTPCYLFRQSKKVVIIKSSCDAVSGQRVNEGIGKRSNFKDDFVA